MLICLPGSLAPLAYDCMPSSTSSYIDLLDFFFQAMTPDVLSMLLVTS
jgi:hypothetical protein